MSFVPQGALVIYPKKAKLTRDTEIFGKMDPYCKIILGNSSLQTKEHKNGGKFPIWKEPLTFQRLFEDTFSMEVWDKETKNDDLVGSSIIHLQSIFEKQKVEQWYPIQYKGKDVGQVLLEITWTPNKDISVQQRAQGLQKQQSIAYSSVYNNQNSSMFDRSSTSISEQYQPPNTNPQIQQRQSYQNYYSQKSYSQNFPESQPEQIIPAQQPLYSQNQTGQNLPQQMIYQNPSIQNQPVYSNQFQQQQSPSTNQMNLQQQQHISNVEQSINPDKSNLEQIEINTNQIEQQQVPMTEAIVQSDEQLQQNNQLNPEIQDLSENKIKEQQSNLKENEDPKSPQNKTPMTTQSPSQPQVPQQNISPQSTNSLITDAPSQGMPLVGQQNFPQAYPYQQTGYQQYPQGQYGNQQLYSNPQPQQYPANYPPQQYPMQQYSQPTLQYPPPTFQYPPPIQQYPPSTQQYPPPVQQYHSHNQQYSPSQQYQPPNEKYHPSTQQYPPAQNPLQQYPPSQYTAQYNASQQHCQNSQQQQHFPTGPQVGNKQNLPPGQFPYPQQGQYPPPGQQYPPYQHTNYQSGQYGK